MQLCISTVPFDEEFHPSEEQSYFLCFDLALFISPLISHCKKFWIFKTYPHMSMTLILLCHILHLFSRLTYSVLCWNCTMIILPPVFSSTLPFQRLRRPSVDSIQDADEQPYNNTFSFSLLF